VRASSSLVSALVLGLVAGGCALNPTTEGMSDAQVCLARARDAQKFWAQARAMQAAGRAQSARAMNTAAGEYRAQAATTSSLSGYLSRGNLREQAEQLEHQAQTLQHQNGSAPRRVRCR